MMRSKVFMPVTLAAALLLSSCNLWPGGTPEGNPPPEPTVPPPDGEPLPGAGPDVGPGSPGTRPPTPAPPAEPSAPPSSSPPAQQPAPPSPPLLDNTRLSWYYLPKTDHTTPGFATRHAALAKQYRAIYLGNTSKKVLYLTFDEGYENGYTPMILDTLRHHGVKAAFFVTLPYLQKQGPLVDRMVREGHIVGNHTATHPSLPTVSDAQLADEILRVDRAFRNQTGKGMHYFRPPAGEFSERTLKLVNDLGYRNVFWSFAYRDWDPGDQKGADYAYNRIMMGVHNGAVLLLHAVSKDNAESLDRILTDLKAQGYSFGTLEDL